jgi:hypothetical protein
MGQDEATRELSLDEAVALANLLQRNERSTRPTPSTVRCSNGAAARGRAAFCRRARASPGAPRRCGGAHRAEPRARADRADCYNNLGIVLQSAGRLDAAISAYQAGHRP